MGIIGIELWDLQAVVDLEFFSSDAWRLLQAFGSLARVFLPPGRR